MESKKIFKLLKSNDWPKANLYNFDINNDIRIKQVEDFFNFKNYNNNCIIDSIEKINLIRSCKDNFYDLIYIEKIIEVLSHKEIFDIFEKINKKLSINGKVIISLVPWVSRNGGKLPPKLNKAFAHIILTQKELNYLGFNLFNFKKKIYNSNYYFNSIISDFNLEIKESYKFIEKVESFFYTEEVYERILSYFSTQEIPFKWMEQSHVIITFERKFI